MTAEHEDAASRNDIETHLEQLMGLERKAAAGLIDADTADAARAELKRRILAADRSTKGAREWLSPVQRKSLVGVVGIVMLAGIGSFALREDLWPGASPRSATAQGASAVEALAAATNSQPLQLQQPGGAQKQVGSVDEMVGRLVERLNRNPSDLEGWRMLGWSYFNTQRYPQAAEAYAKAIELDPDNPDLASAYGEALVRAGDGRVTGDAKSAFEQALRANAKDPRARFFMGLAKAQAGDRAAALDDWIAILGEADSKEPWFADLNKRAAELAEETGVDLTARRQGQAAAPVTSGSARDGFRNPDDGQ